MKAKEEVFLSIVAFTLLLMTFCVVALTTNYTNKFVNEPVRHPSSDSGKGESNSVLIRSSADNLDKTAKESEPKSTLFATSIHHADSRPGKPEMEAWSADYHLTRSSNEASEVSEDSDRREYPDNEADSHTGKNNKEHVSEGVE